MTVINDSQTSLPQQIASQLQRSIVRGDIRPKSKLPAQRAMVQQFSSSRATVREAISLLQNGGLVDTHHGGGSFCVNLLADFFKTDVDEISQPDQSLQIQVLEMREVLEGEAAFYCAQRASDDELKQIEADYLGMSRRVRGVNTLRQAKSDLTFHMHIADNCHHLLVLSLSQILYTRYFNAIYGVLSQTFKKRGRYPEKIGSQHQQICQAVCARDAEGARQAAQMHIAYTRGLLFS